MYSTIVPNQQRAIGYLLVSDLITDFDKRIPPANGFKMLVKPEAVTHRLSDGGIRQHVLKHKSQANIHFDYLEESTRDDLKEVFENHDEMFFVPFGTTTGWDGTAFPCIWTGPFGFNNFSDNAANSGYSGDIELVETPT
jgi:hypothetical protein